jgi:hypothetical protein
MYFQPTEHGFDVSNGFLDPGVLLGVEAMAQPPDQSRPAAVDRHYADFVRSETGSLLRTAFLLTRDGPAGLRLTAVLDRLGPGTIAVTKVIHHPVYCPPVAAVLRAGGTARQAMDQLSGPQLTWQLIGSDLHVTAPGWGKLAVIPTAPNRPTPTTGTSPVFGGSRAPSTVVHSATRPTAHPAS